MPYYLLINTLAARNGLLDTIDKYAVWTGSLFLLGREGEKNVIAPFGHIAGKSKATTETSTSTWEAESRGSTLVYFTYRECIVFRASPAAYITWVRICVGRLLTDLHVLTSS